MIHLLRPPVGGAAPAVEQNGEYGLDEHQILEERREELLDRFKALGLVGKSLALLRVFDVVERVSRTDPPIPVLITGETGTGKELVAHAIHACDPERNTKRFVVVDCSAVNEETLTSELFGHKRGAFTGAVTNRQGAFRATGKGTVFLDVIETMSKNTQNKLLRVVEERRVRPVGADTDPAFVDVRIIAATNVPLSDLIAQGMFRGDLYYRFRGCEIVIPPLRERREDIAPQAQHFLERHSGVTQGRVTAIHPAALALLTTLRWRGNSRELDFLIWNALLQKRGGNMLTADDLRPLLRESTPSCSTPTRSSQFSLLEGKGEIERRLITDTLSACNQRRDHTAQALGISRVSLYRKMKKYGLMR